MLIQLYPLAPMYVYTTRIFCNSRVFVPFVTIRSETYSIEFKREERRDMLNLNEGNGLMIQHFVSHFDVRIVRIGAYHPFIQM